jgi:hypothetical protein
MSEYKVPYTQVLEINPHDNADRLEVATVYGFQVVVIKSHTEYSIEGNKKALKWVSEDYLDDASNTDFH